MVNTAKNNCLLRRRYQEDCTDDTLIRRNQLVNKNLSGSEKLLSFILI